MDILRNSPKLKLRSNSKRKRVCRKLHAARNDNLCEFNINSSFFNGSTFYLQPAATLNLSASFSNNSVSSFNYIIMDNALGDHVDMQVDSFVSGLDRKVYVPRNRTY